MSGCIRRWKVKDEHGVYIDHDKRGLAKGEHSYDLIFTLGRGVNGERPKQQWKRFHGSRKQAEQKLNELVGEVNRGEFVEPSKVTIGQWLDSWVEKAIKPPRCTQNTYNSYCFTIKKHLKPNLGHLFLQQLTPLHVERYYADRSATLAPTSVAIHHAILTSALKAAVNAGVLRTNVASRATNKPKVRMGEDVLHNVWNVDEVRRFLTAVKEAKNAQYSAFFALALDSGMRKSELLGLQWQDIDGSSLRVERQLFGMTEDGGGLITSLPKGKRARLLDLSSETDVLLREHKRQQAELKLKNRLHYVDHKLVFAQAWDQKHGSHAALGWPLNKSTVCKQLDKMCKAAGVKRITIHGLRHTCATLLLSANVPVNVVQRRLGHADAAITLNTYAHVIPSMQQDAASRLAMLLHG